MLDIREVLMEENVNLELEARTKEEVFTQMTRMLYENARSGRNSRSSTSWFTAKRKA